MANEAKPAATLKLLTRDAILKADDMRFETVEVPEWGGSVRVKALNGTERDAFETSLITGKGKNVTVNMQNMRAKFVLQTAVDSNGKALFDYADVAALGRKSAAALDRVFAAARRLSGLSDEDVEELTKNSESDQGRRFYFELALALRWPSVEWGLEHISSRELAEWLAYASVEPIGERRADMRTALLCSVLANIYRAKGSQPIKIEDFMLDFWASKENQPGKAPAQMLEWARRMAAAFGGQKTEEIKPK